MVKKLMYLYTLSSVHPGIGSSTEVVDLPIQREKTTDYPVIFGSTLKGALRDNFDKETANNLFGSEETQGENVYASAVSVSDAKILLFPVKSGRGIFAYVTCPSVIKRFERDLEIINRKFTSGIAEVNNVLISNSQSNLLISKDTLILDEFSFTNFKPSELVSNFGKTIAKEIFDGSNGFKFWQEKMEKDIVIVPDDTFRFFVKSLTEVVTRIKINDETKIVEKGALWTEENIPSDTLFYSIAIFDKSRKLNEKIDENAVFDRFKSVVNKKTINIGGNITVGKGFIYLKIGEGGDKW